MSYQLRENEPLSRHTFFKIGGPARFFAEADNAADFIAAIKTALSLDLPWVILGAGSNVLVADRGFTGMVVYWRGGDIAVRGEVLRAEAPVAMARAAAESLRAGLRGLEWAVGIPGSIGGSARGNAGCFGKEIKDVVKSLEVFDVSRGELEEWPREKAEFNYRSSIFKRRPELVVLSATFELLPGDRAEGENLVREYSMHRAETQDIGSMSAGCIFKNILWTQRGVDRSGLIRRFPELGRFGDSPAIPAGFLIDRAGLKGWRVGGAVISDRHGNFFLNSGQATAEDVVTLIGIAKERVQRLYGLMLEEEIQYVGFE